jgi:hypothetical protein
MRLFSQAIQGHPASGNFYYHNRLFFRKCPSYIMFCLDHTPDSNLLFSEQKAGQRRGTAFMVPDNITVFLRAPSLRGGFRVLFHELTVGNCEEVRQGRHAFSESPLHLSRGGSEQIAVRNEGKWNIKILKITPIVSTNLTTQWLSLQSNSTLGTLNLICTFSHQCLSFILILGSGNEQGLRSCIFLVD